MPTQANFADLIDSFLHINKRFFESKEVASSSYSLVLDDSFRYVRFISSSATVVTVPNSSEVDWIVGTEIILEQAGQELCPDGKVYLMWRDAWTPNFYQSSPILRVYE